MTWENTYDDMSRKYEYTGPKHKQCDFDYRNKEKQIRQTCTSLMQARPGQMENRSKEEFQLQH